MGWLMPEESGCWLMYIMLERLIWGVIMCFVSVIQKSGAVEEFSEIQCEVRNFMFIVTALQIVVSTVYNVW